MIPFKKFVQESPDVVYVNGEELTWNFKDARTFGWLAGVPFMKGKYFMMAKLNIQCSHYEMVQNLFGRIENALLAINENIRDLPLNQMPIDKMRRVLTKSIQGSPLFKMVDANKFIEELLKIKPLMDDFLDGYMTDQWLNTMAQNNGDSFKQDMNYKIRTKVFNNCGRIWTKGKVLSFWLPEHKATPEIIDTVFNYFNVPEQDKQNYLIDVINVREIKKEETPEKVLPSYKEYRTRKSKPSAIQSKDNKKMEQEFMAKQHGVSGAQKAKFKGAEMPPVGAKRYSELKPLPVRQQAYTSESKKHIA